MVCREVRRCRQHLPVAEDRDAGVQGNMSKNPAQHETERQLPVAGQSHSVRPYIFHLDTVRTYWNCGQAPFPYQGNRR